MSKLIKKIVTENSKRIEFRTFDHLPKDVLVVIDYDCQMERSYKIGATQMLNDWEQELIVSFEQIIEAWESNSIWF